MEQRKFTQEEIEKTIQSIDGISRADMPPFFYTRLQAKLEQQPSLWNTLWSVITKPAVSLVTLSLLVVLNIAAISYYSKSSKQTVSQESSGIQTFAQEYDLSSSSVYNDKTNR